MVERQFRTRRNWTRARSRFLNIVGVGCRKTPGREDYGRMTGPGTSTVTEIDWVRDRRWGNESSRRHYTNLKSSDGVSLSPQDRVSVPLRTTDLCRRKITTCQDSVSSPGNTILGESAPVSGQRDDQLIGSTNTRHLDPRGSHVISHTNTLDILYGQIEGMTYLPPTPVYVLTPRGRRRYTVDTRIVFGVRTPVESGLDDKVLKISFPDL